MNTFWLCICIGSLVAAVSAIGFAVWQTVKLKKTINAMRKMLDEAASGTLTQTYYDETVPSMLEQKLLRFINKAKLTHENVQEEKDNTSRWISDISHQIKTPLTNVIMYSQLLEEENLTQDAQNFAGQIQVNSKKINFLVKALIKTSRLEQGILQMSAQAVAVQEMLENVWQAAKEQADEKGVKLNLEIGEKQLVMADAKWTVEALYNVVDNAIKYTASGGTVKLRSQSYDFFCRIDVIDTGAGIDEKYHAQIFSRFWRAPQFAQTEGLGIGLTLARKIIAGQNGYIRVQSSVGQGATFSVFLPIALNLN